MYPFGQPEILFFQFYKIQILFLSMVWGGKNLALPEFLGMCQMWAGQSSYAFLAAKFSLS